ncbi:MAG: hypothetical protein FWE64_03840 [Alphaproteobacteria bacterium]|nr:hypothetical protein [Alphaproteobacteria bacterium]
MGQNIDDIQNIMNIADQRKDRRNARKEINNERAQILKQMERDATKRTNLINKTLAKQRAKFGAGGMSGKGMTEEAVLKRLREETGEPFDEKDINHRNRLDKLDRIKRNIRMKRTDFFRLIKRRIPDFFWE